MDKSFPLEERSIRQLYLDGRDAATYMIPVYQRNYAWEKDEIDTLVKDVHDSFRKDRTSPYYIGTLVSFNRGDSEHEIIDGQQRLTTIYIIPKGFRNNASEKQAHLHRPPHIGRHHKQHA